MKNGLRTTIMYEKDHGRSKTNLCTNSAKARIDAKKSDAVCVVGLERNRSLQPAAVRSNE